MDIRIGGGRAARRLAASLTVVVSGCLQVSILAASTFAAGKQSPALYKDPLQTGQMGETNSSRPRRIEGSFVARYPSPGGPVIRVALMTDVESVDLASASGLIVHPAGKTTDDRKKIELGSLHVELRRQTVSRPHLDRDDVTFTVRVATSQEARKARKLSDELKKKFFEPVTTAFNERHREYSITIGKFASRGEAVSLADRLRRAGYDDSRVVANPQLLTPADRNVDAAKRKTQRNSPSNDQPGSKTEQRSLRIVAISGDKVAGSSENTLAVAPLKTARDDRGTEPTSLPQNDKIRKTATARDAAEPDEADRVFVRPASVRVAGKDYRGEICLILNPRGRINVVNSLPLEEYLLGVVPVELSPGQFPQLEALKAQAVAARSYALARLGRDSEEGFDLVDDTRAQVYGGLSVERDLSNRAVEETRGIVAAYPNAEGRLEPIEALYTANCGGRTENNEEVFGGSPRPYLRGVSCAPDGPAAGNHAITSGRGVDPVVGNNGRSLNREVGLLSVLGFSFPRRITSQYLRNSPDRLEVQSWAEHIARLRGQENPRYQRGDPTRLVDFARLMAASHYGEGRAGTLLAPADVDYMLQGLPVRELPREARADVAMLLRDGLLRLPAGVIDWRATITRGEAIQVIARALESKRQTVVLSSQASTSTPEIHILESDVISGMQNGRVIIAGAQQATQNSDRVAGRFQSVNATSPARPLRAEQNGQPGGGKRTETTYGAPAKSMGADQRSSTRLPGLEIAGDAWLFRKLADESYPVDKLLLIGGERVTYHLNPSGMVDFLEASISDNGAASDRFSSVAQWQERVPAEDLRQRLAGARVNVGKLDRIEPVAFSSSNRVTEVEISGDKGRARLPLSKIRAALGVKERLFVVDREVDGAGRVVAFLFTGRGWGHGVGMCQIGAYGLAKEGYSYTAILQKYYTGIKLQKAY